MKQKNFQMSVTISALNEEETIGFIIRDILNQKRIGWNLKEILVYCDGCTDNTVKVVRAIKSKKIKILDAKKKKGKVYRVNQALSAFKGDALLILDADCRIEGRDVISKIVSEFKKDKNAVLVGGDTRVYSPKTFIERAIYSSYVPYFEAREQLRGGHNVFGCTGACIAVKRDFAKKIKIPSHIINEDTYLYFTCLSRGYNFRHAAGAIVRYELAGSLKVYLKQMFRTQPEAVRATYGKEFGKLIDQEYKRPRAFYLKSIWKAFRKNPVGTMFMIAIKLSALPFYRLISPKYSLDWYGDDAVSNEKGKRTISISSYDDTNNPFYAGGGSVAVHEIAKRLSESNRVIVYTGRYPESKNVKVEGVEYRRIGVSFGGPKFGQLIYHLTLPYFVLTGKYDLWIESFTPPISTSFLQLFTKKPVVGLVHMLSGEDMKRKYKLPFNLIENVGLKTYKRFIVLTTDTKNKILNINKKADIEVIPNGVNIPKKKNTGSDYILFMGRIEVNQKGLDLLLNAFKKVRKGSDIKLQIAGSGTDKEVQKLKSIIAKLRLHNSVKYLGRVSGKKKDKVFREAQLMIMPSRFETFPICALEALSYELPIVTFDIDGLGWLSDECAVKVNAFSEEEMSEAILKLLKSPSLRKKMRKAGRKFVGNYTWDKVYKKYLKFLNQTQALNIRRLSI